MALSGESASPPSLGARRWGDLRTRALSAIVLVAVAIMTLRQGGAVFNLLWFAAAAAILWEWQRLIGGARLLLRVIAGSLILAAVAALVIRSDIGLALLVIVVGSGLLAGLAGPRRRIWAAGGMVYAALLVVSLISLRTSFPFGARSIVWLFVTVWATDCFAYFGGRLMGGPKLWPRISPSKTWSGTLTGVFAGGLLGTIVALHNLPEPRAFAPILILSFAAAALSQAGDAFESGIKRHFGVKDSSRLIPGHGGVMDRLDGFIAAAVLAFAVGLVRNGPSVAGGLFYWA